MARPFFVAVLLILVFGAARGSLAGIPALLPGEEIVYQTVQSGSNYRDKPNFISQIQGNAYTEQGDEVLLGGTAEYLTNIAVGTQTGSHPSTPGYNDGVSSDNDLDHPDTGIQLQMSVYLLDGPMDVAGDVSAWDSLPEDMPQPGTLIARSTVPAPVYPAGGVSLGSNGLNNLSDPSDNYLDPFIVNFPFPKVLLPADRKIAFLMIHLDAQGNPDGFNFDGNSFGLFHSKASLNSTVLASGGPYYNNTTFNTNLVGQSRTGPIINQFTNPGQWLWIKYLGKYESTRGANYATEATIIAAEDPIFGDMNGDGVLDNFDIQPFEVALTNPGSYLTSYPRLSDYGRRGDIDDDGAFDNFDIQPFEGLLTSAAPTAVPEPASWFLLVLGLGVTLAARRRIGSRRTAR